MTEIRINRGESLERALKKLKKKLDREGTLREARSRRHYEKPSEKRYRKMKEAKFNAMLQAKRDKEWSS